MIFSSAIFLFVFLPAFLGVYYCTPARFRSTWIVVASYVFYGWWRVDYLLVVLAISMISYTAAYVISNRQDARHRLWAVRVGVGLNLAILGYFKYTTFFLDGLSSFSALLAASPFPAIEIVLPIGISFLTFQSISYIIDVARRDAPPARNLMDFLAFSALFPQLIAGPVLRYKDLSDQLSDRTHSFEKFAEGVSRFVVGLSMKLLIADTVAPLADRMFALDAPSFTEAWLGAVAYTVQLFFDFAGYSAMAIGLGLMIGFRFVENFNAPYISRSITEFWQRWHISLSNWLRDYLYIPLGGNRGGAWKTYRNLMLTMILGGFWHGASWTFLLWGAWHGGWLSLERALGAKAGAVWGNATGWLLTMTIVIIGWVMFRATSVSDAFAMYSGMAGLNGWRLSPEMLYLNQPVEYLGLAVGITLALAPTKLDFRIARRSETACLSALCYLMLCTQTNSPFLYFQF